jgi:hypothetical protein
MSLWTLLNFGITLKVPVKKVIEFFHHRVMNPRIFHHFFYCAFPDYKNPYPFVKEFVFDFSVPLYVCLKFGRPVIYSGFGKARVPASGVTVPETAMNEHRDFRTDEIQIWTSRNGAVVDSISVSAAEER